MKLKHRPQRNPTAYQKLMYIPPAADVGIPKQGWYDPNVAKRLTDRFKKGVKPTENGVH